MAQTFRRVVTTHNDAGLSVFRSVEKVTPARVPGGDADFALVWTTSTVPADNNDETDGATRDAGMTLRGGSVIRMVEILPGKASPMHRSDSIDYGIVLNGKLELELDGGEVQLLHEGDVVVQRGTNHLWRNPSADTPCRIVFILIEAAPIIVGKRVLAEIHPAGHSRESAT
jgi:quercetin dioxygenase-like cupin family protein